MEASDTATWSAHTGLRGQSRIRRGRKRRVVHATLESRLTADLPYAAAGFTLLCSAVARRRRSGSRAALSRCRASARRDAQSEQNDESHAASSLALSIETRGSHPRTRAYVGREKGAKMSRALFLAAFLVGCATNTPATTAPQTRGDVHAPRTASDGETIGADESVPQEQLNRGMRASFRPGDANPFAIDLPPGWVMGPNGPEPASAHRASPEVKSQTGSVPQRLQR